MTVNQYIVIIEASCIRFLNDTEVRNVTMVLTLFENNNVITLEFYFR